MYNVQFIYNLAIWLFTDTEFAKDIVEHLLRSDLSCNLTQSIKTILQIHTQKFSANLQEQAILDAFDSFQCAHQSLVMACTTDSYWDRKSVV